jgi:sugar-specific transcriptional regulator TrmB
MYNELFEELGLTKNEAKIYQTLLDKGESPVGKIATEAAINRRNVYDSLARLIEKGLIFEIRQHNENIYQAVDPRKLMEGLKEKERALDAALPDLLKMYQATPHTEDVSIYRGVEGWKNYMRDILRVGKDVYTLGGKGAWTDDRLVRFFEQFSKDAEQKNIAFHMLIDHEAKETSREMLGMLEINYKYLPEGYSTNSAIDIFGDYVVILSNIIEAKIDEHSSFTVIQNKNIAESFRVWFKLMWEMSSSKKK